MGKPLSSLLTAIHETAEQRPDAVSFADMDGTPRLTYRALETAVDGVATRLRNAGVRCVALLADNSAAWAVVDLACVQAEIPLIPVPLFFSPQQMLHLLQSSGADALIGSDVATLAAQLSAAGVACDEAELLDAAAGDYQIIRLQTASQPLPDGCAKITYTSGSTGDPKGVCLRQAVMEQVARSLAEATGATADDRHLALLPYATLLENIGGIYAPLYVGATVVSAPLASVGLQGASGLDVQQLVTALHRSAATTCIMIPQMLHALVAALEQGMPKPAALRYMAVGGAPVSDHLLARAAALELPVFEGYGLSEAASVVAVNRPGCCKPGSVGKPLPHVQLSFADDGEIMVRGALFSGYLGDADSEPPEAWPTGDIGYLDADGFLFLNGRKKHIFITAFGRNVSPEWVERELAIEPAVAQCCVFGEARHFNVAVIVQRAGADDAQVEAAVAAANARLPDYARIGRWLLADEPFTVDNGLWTGTGRPRRTHIFARYQNQIEQIYEES